jgi:hypothetical protein
MTPTRAIKVECKWCMNGDRISLCNSEVCKLKKGNLNKSPLRRIKVYCLDCLVGTIYDVKDCDGIVLNNSTGKCPLHPYRLGKDSLRKKKKLTEEEKEKLVKRLRRTRG